MSAPTVSPSSLYAVSYLSFVLSSMPKTRQVPKEHSGYAVTAFTMLKAAAVRFTDYLMDKLTAFLMFSVYV